MEKTVGIAACSNGIKRESREETEALISYLEARGNRVICSRCLYERNGPFSGSGEERAGELMALFENPEVRDIYDISGGDMANELLPYLSYDRIRKSKAVFWGYSDLTTLLNAVYTKTGKPGVLYSVRNLVRPEFGALQRSRFEKKIPLFAPEFQIVQGNHMEGILVGGNIRCFLKLAGTEYFPDLEGKLLLLEACSGRVPQMVTYLSQLQALGAFDKVGGILLGTFSQMEKEGCQPEIIPLLQHFAGKELPIAVTGEIGHGPDARAIWIGERFQLSR